MASTSNLENNVVAGVQGDGAAASQVNKGDDKCDTELAKNDNAEEERTFTLFPKLAPEIQLRVWSFAPVTARYLEVRVSQSNQEQWQIACVSPASNLFFTCRDARAEAIKRSTLLRSTRPRSAATYYDPSVDVLVLRYPYDNVYAHWFEFTPWLDSLPRELVKRIRYMIVEGDEPVDFWSPMGPFTMMNYYFLSADYYLKQASINKLSGLETVGIARLKSDRRKKITGFVDMEDMTADDQNDLSREHIRHEMETSGQAFHDFQPPKVGWVQPKYILGGFVLEE